MSAAACKELICDDNAVATAKNIPEIRRQVSRETRDRLTECNDNYVKDVLHIVQQDQGDDD